ncbi:efflux RND transporter periplasmic adaptor subunit [Marinobacter sp. UBA3607]|jgi:multidrug efflux pump subunit AcrA (membrane-fusion protein)|uniref:efflux RND transporter periplasmic adaptor subunit n=1 Tax=Marinobacter sp. UBA3607 TaxID=1946820 RepID=UPI00257AF120|nr:HlyD family efflux transporter periplasmic adaptor subunit [Marinobacter sp. UBA3607]|tara:strand:+ start:6771 stop:8009 length:1239 start_codon:yes stop_codon:yes gene_type:complete
MFKRLLPLIILAVGVLVFIALKATRPEPAEVTATERSWRVEVQAITPGSQVPVLPLYGEVLAPDQQTITATLAGRVAERPASEGLSVKQGDLLLALDEADIGPALAQARAQVDDLDAQISSEQVRYRNDQEALKSEQAIVANARRQFERIESLVGRNLASRENLEGATDALARAELTVSTRQRAIQEHPARLQSLEAKLAQARANLSATERDVDRARVVAPFDGVVTGIEVAVGDQVSRNEPLLTVYPTRGLEVRARVPQVFQNELITALGQGQTLTAISDNGHEFVLARFAGLSAPAGTEAVLELQGEPGGLRPGALLPLTLERPARQQAVDVPFSALYGADSVYLMTDDGRMQRVEVERIGEARSENGERRLLIAGEQLTPGARLITTHLPNAVTGLKVELADADGEPAQ